MWSVVYFCSRRNCSVGRSICPLELGFENTDMLVSRFCGSNTCLFLALNKVGSCKLTKFISKVSITVHIYDTNTRCQCLQEMNKMSMTLAFMIRALRLLRTFKLVILSYVRLKEQCSHLYISDTEFKPANENIWVNI